MKGVSEFITTVLIIGITISVGIALFNWIQPFTRSQSDKVATDSTNKLQCQPASIRITSGTLTLSTKNISVVAENTGTVNLATFNFNVILTNGTSVNVAASPSITLAPSSRQTFTSVTPVATNASNITSVRLTSLCSSAISIYDDLDGSSFTEV